MGANYGVATSVWKMQGNPRAFFVKFTGEGVDDHGGPYRAAFQSAVAEEAKDLLGLFVPCANGRAKRL